MPANIIFFLLIKKKKKKKYLQAFFSKDINKKPQSQLVMPFALEPQSQLVMPCASRYNPYCFLVLLLFSEEDESDPDNIH